MAFLPPNQQRQSTEGTSTEGTVSCSKGKQIINAYQIIIFSQPLQTDTEANTKKLPKIRPLLTSQPSYRDSSTIITTLTAVPTATVHWSSTCSKKYKKEEQ